MHPLFKTTINVYDHSGINGSNNHYMYSNCTADATGLTGSGTTVIRDHQYLADCPGYYFQLHGRYFFLSDGVTSAYVPRIFKMMSLQGSFTSAIVYNVEEFEQDYYEGAGNIVQSGILATDGTYPNNGKHTDGYWYKKVTTIPQTSSTSPSQNGTLFLIPKTTKRSA
jgi:hypothetical protein